MISGKHYPMKSDVKEKKNAYLLEIDLPGCRKEDIKAYIEEGYLHVEASFNKEKSNEQAVSGAKLGTGGRLIHRECYSGDYRRSFYVGDCVELDQIKAAYKRGVLKLTIPKKLATDAVSEKTIAIEG